MTTTTTTGSLANVPHPAIVALPPKAVKAEEWQPGDGDRFYRYFEGEERHVGESISVWAHGLQWEDGRIGSGEMRDAWRDGAPGISVDGVCWEKSLSSDTARRLADLLVMAADEVDRWSAR
jgi:hypothetical protein